MSTTIYLVRHGESEANEQGVFLGHGDLNLTKIGIKQATVAADYIRSEIGRPDAIYSSDLMRAYHTAHCTAAHFNMPIFTDKNLREVEAGVWDLTKFAELTEKYKETYNVWLTNIGLSRCDGGESVEELQKRVVAALTEIAKKHDNQTIFVFSHATPIRVFAAHCLKKSLGEIKDVPWAANASLTKAVFKNGTFELVEYSFDKHMRGFVTELPKNV